MGTKQISYGTPTKTQNFTRATLQSSQTPTGNVRVPVSGSGLATRGVILNDPALEECVVGQPRVDFQIIRKIALGGAKADVPINFSFPVSKIWIASKDTAHLTDSLYFHFVPLNKGVLYAASGNSINPTGVEQWYDMTLSPAGNLTFFGKVLKFRTPFTTGFFDIGQEAGGTDYNICIAGADGDVVELFANNLGVTSG